MGYPGNVDSCVLLGKPSAPENLCVTDVHKDSVTLKWDAPETDGGMPVKTYNVEKRDAMKTTWLSAGRVDGDTFTFKVSHLIEGNDYYFRVTAENKIGAGEPAELSKAVTAKLPYGMLIYICDLCVVTIVQSGNY